MLYDSGTTRAAAPAPGQGASRGNNSEMVTATRAPARRGLTAARLVRMLELERAAGCHDRAVIGGLDAFLDRQAGQSAEVQELAVRLAPARYRELSPAARATWLNTEIARLTDDAAAAPAGAPAPAQPAATPEPAAGRARAKAPSAPPAETALTDARLGIRRNELACYETLGIATVADLLIHYPFRYHDFSATRSVRELLIGEEGAVSGVVVSVTAERWRGRMHGACKAQVRDAFGNMLAVTWFNQPWLATRLPRGSGIALVGKVGFNGRRGEVTMANPEFYLFDAREEYRGRLVPVYRSTRGLSQTMLRRHIEKAIERYAEAIDEPLPGGLRARHKLIGRRQAFLEIHNPPHYAAARRAERRLAFDELLGVQLAVVRRKRRLAQAGLAPAIAEPDTVRGFLESLPFVLTAAQRRSLTEIEGEIASTTPMARLLQGDVGSGKTVVALAAMLACANNGSQATLMAPTEVLAEQHFRTIATLLDTGRNLLSFGLADLPYMRRRHARAVLLTGSAGARKRREALAAIRNGSAGLVVGTHALIQDEVEFRRLGLAVVDEQHRFGVEQRSALRGGPDGATAPHLLVMTATPIPRSLALTAYGDLDLSLIDELPPARAGITTRMLVGRAREEAFARARVEIAAGRQVFVICPLVDGSERVVSRAATEEAERLRNEQFPDLASRIELLHGRMRARDKEAAMQRFARGEAAILVSTAVVEVGIDVPNATVMIIESADRFGLAQLHQFRGRVGRGEARSFCYLLSDEPSEDAVQRLTLVERNNNGFDLAQADLELRGPGDVFGLRQSGQPRLRASALLDGQLIITTKAEAEAVLDSDAALTRPEHAGLHSIAARAESGIIGEAH